MRTGDPVLPQQLRAIAYPPRVEIRPGRDDIDELLADLVPDGGAWQGSSPKETPILLWELGRCLSHACHAGEALGLLIHHNVELGWHRDRQAPGSTWNITMVLRPAFRADFLVIDDTAWRMTDGSYVHFDNQLWHGCYQFDGVERYALTFWVPAP